MDLVDYVDVYLRLYISVLDDCVVYSCGVDISRGLGCRSEMRLWHLESKRNPNKYTLHYNKLHAYVYV